MHSEQLIQTLIEQTRTIINEAEKLKTKNLSQLTWRPAPASWNILECLQHLNLYGDYYLPEIEQAISSSKSQPVPDFRSGILGNYFANSMLPKAKLNKMKTFKDKDPIHSSLDINILNNFISQQHRLIDLLNLARKVNLNKAKVSISISRLLKLKLGDTFRFLINHELRHLQQIKNIQVQMPMINTI